MRPTTSRVREATFNALYSLGLIEGAVVVDLFGGTGAMAIEALSRGASYAHIVDQAPRAIGAIEENLETTKFEDRATVHRRDAFSYLGLLESNGTEVDLVIVDPPYRFDQWDELFAALPDATVVVESGEELDPGPQWSNIRTRTYGGSVVMIMERAAETTSHAPTTETST